MKIVRIQGLLLVLALLCIAPVGAADRLLSRDALAQGASLAGGWRFQPGDNLAWAAPEFDDSDWPTRTIPHRAPKGGAQEALQFSWYRLTIQLQGNIEAAGGQSPLLGVQIGKVLSAYELYIGGELVGGVGALPPDSEVNYDRMQVYAIPASALTAQGELVLAMRVWGGSALSTSLWGEGPHEGAFRIGYYRDLIAASFFNELPAVAMCILFAGFGLYHLYLFSRNRQLRTYFWYGLVALNISLYAFLSSQLRYYLDWPFALYEKVEFGTIYLLPALFIQMLLSLLAKPAGLLMRAYQGAFLVFSLLVLCVPGMSILFRTLFYWEMLCLPVLLWMPWQILRAARTGNPEARTSLIGLVIFIAACANDILIDIAGLTTPRLLPVGFVAIMLSMVISLANRFTTVLTSLESEVAQQTAELRSANRRLAVAAREDPLTGLLNRRGLLDIAAAEVQRFQRTGRTFSVMLVDLDHFKQFNDRHGHACGDFVLQEVAGLLCQRLRDMDTLARWGGEEFILIVPETSGPGAAALAENLRSCVAGHRFHYAGQEMAVTLTLGLATFVTGDNLEQCIARADAALYRGKAAGRNRVEIEAPEVVGAIA
ncbi:sensor domain-containing diguanylate cyclase [Parahaliea aestuarii]|uniref:diguanylate cyclase n=1 Tax=Parahaliea aestuarii TaxID=1852021 RepID=A0A5C8ZYM4_9GAMM|nr:diguanylate cyclase [Parahaliea aestuarii]TXS93578.1 diguanylate cyclase [Parahaliea aestuarii]